MKWIIGGTSEARKLIERLEDFNNYILTIATEDGKEFFDTDNLFIGRLSRDEMVDFAKDNNIDMIVDLSHPYAKIVSSKLAFAVESNTSTASCMSYNFSLSYDFILS
jgi:precorrin-6A/cobalt-precorrin-6A reductase